MSELSLDDLYAKAALLAGRPVEIDRLANGQYIVMWMRFEHSPPKAATTEAEALERFIEMMEKRDDSTIPVLSDPEVYELLGDVK